MYLLEESQAMGTASKLQGNPPEEQKEIEHNKWSGSIGLLVKVGL